MGVNRKTLCKCVGQHQFNFCLHEHIYLTCRFQIMKTLRSIPPFWRDTEDLL